MAHFCPRLSMRPKLTKAAETKRQTPNPSFNTKVEISAANKTLVSLSADTRPIGASASAHTIIQ